MLGFISSAESFTVTRNGAELYMIPVGSTVIEVGIGENSFSMTKGSFRIKEKLFSKKALSLVSARSDIDTAELTLSEGKLILSAAGDRLKAEPLGLEKYNRLYITLPALQEEHVYGTGETFSEFDLRGQKVNVWVAEHQNAKMIGKKILKIKLGLTLLDRKQKFSNYETYYAQPTFLSSRKYYFHSDTTARSVFDFSDKNKHVLRTDSIAAFYLGFGDSFEAVISDLSLLLGRQPELPDWVYDGAILGIQGGTDIMMKKVENCLAHGMKVNGVWIQDWEGRRVTAFGKQLMWNWEWDRDLYPGLDAAIKELNAKGIKVLGYCNPFLAIEKPLYKYASEKGYCVKAEDGSDYFVTITTFPAAMVDLTNPEARDWLKSVIINNMIGFGLSGWMADFGEYLPTDCVLFSGEDPQLAHNTWPARWAQLNREAVEEAGKLGEIFFFTRAGYSKTPEFSTMMWNGDNHVDFSVDNGLPSVIPAMLSLTCSGYGISHSDIGGYTTFGKMCRSEELYMRWCEMNAYSPLMRSHEGNNPDLNAQFDASEAVLDHQTLMSKIHVLLKPYIKSCVEYNSVNGLGVVRPLFFHYSEDRAFSETTEYMLGRDILVAPVIKKGADSRKVYLPDDKWVELSTGKAFSGGVYSVSAPFGKVPVFYRESSSELLLNAVGSIRSLINEYILN